MVLFTPCSLQKLGNKMPAVPENLGIYAGSFDPITLGHVDIIERSSKLFDELVVTVARNTSKHALFSGDEKIELISQVLAHLPNVSVEFFSGLLVGHAKERGARALVRGIRTVSDFEYEFKMALTNRQMDEDIETIFLMTEGKYAHISSSLIKEIVQMDGDVTGMVPPIIKTALEKKLANR